MEAADTVMQWTIYEGCPGQCHPLLDAIKDLVKVTDINEYFFTNIQPF